MDKNHSVIKKILLSLALKYCYSIVFIRFHKVLWLFYNFNDISFGSDILMDD